MKKSKVRNEIPPHKEEEVTLDEAIKHCEEKVRDESICKECRADHKQLAAWLVELKRLRKQNKTKK